MNFALYLVQALCTSLDDPFGYQRGANLIEQGHDGIGLSRSCITVWSGICRAGSRNGGLNRPRTLNYRGGVVKCKFLGGSSSDFSTRGSA